MATMNKVIERVDAVKVNVFDEESKFRWLAELDGMVARVVMQRNEPPAYEYPRDMERELLIPAPWEGLYERWMEAKIDYHNREYNHYNNVILMFNEQFEEYKKAYIREHMPKSAGNFRGL